MAAHADDLRFFYAEHLGDTVEVTTPSGGTVELPEPLTPGRYMIRCTAYGGADVWIKQGVFGDVTAAAAPPATKFVVHTDSAHLNYPILVVMVRDENDNAFSFFGDGGTAEIQITKISRDKR